MLIQKYKIKVIIPIKFSLLLKIKNKVYEKYFQCVKVYYRLMK